MILPPINDVLFKVRFDLFFKALEFPPSVVSLPETSAAPEPLMTKPGNYLATKTANPPPLQTQASLTDDSFLPRPLQLKLTSPDAPCLQLSQEENSNYRRGSDSIFLLKLLIAL